MWWPACRGATVYSALHPLPCTSLVVDTPCPWSVSSPPVQATRLLPGVGGLSAVLLDRLHLPLSLGRGKPGGPLTSCGRAASSRYPLGHSPPPPEPSPWLRTSRVTRLRMRTPPGCSAPRAVDFSGVLASVCEGLGTYGVTGRFFVAPVLTSAPVFLASSGVLLWWDGGGGYGVVHRVEHSVDGGHCAGQTRLVSICCV